LGTREEPRAGDKERGTPGSIEPESAYRFEGLTRVGLGLKHELVLIRWSIAESWKNK